MKFRARALTFLVIFVLALVWVINYYSERKTEVKKITYFELKEVFDEERPGFGNIDYPGGMKNDIPKSYAMILNAELNRCFNPNEKDKKLSKLGLNAANWLINNSSIDGKVFGWGLPVSWDAFQDGTVNDKNTKYTISNAIVIGSLLNWAAVDPAAPTKKIFDLIKKVIEPMILTTNYNSVEGMISYSNSPNDYNYTCFNPSILMAGQLQRFSKVVSDSVFALKIQQIADRNFKFLIANKKEENGHWYWNYSNSEDTPNDLPHAVYIMHGIYLYKKYDGKLARELDSEKIYSHLQDFIYWNKFKRFPTFYLSFIRNSPPRSYDLGGLMYFMSISKRRKKELDNIWINQIEDYKNNLGEISILPKSKTIINEYEAYMLAGLSSYFYKPLIIE